MTSEKREEAKETTGSDLNGEKRSSIGYPSTLTLIEKEKLF